MIDDVEIWERELREAGWKEIHHTQWECPAGYRFRGPYGAWKNMKADPGLNIPNPYRK